jgi:hypothetical protein
MGELERAREWWETQGMLKAEGETLDFRATVKEQVPEAEIFCAIPLMKDIALVMDGHPDSGEPGEKRKRLADLSLVPKDTGAIITRKSGTLVWSAVAMFFLRHCRAFQMGSVQQKQLWYSPAETFFAFIGNYSAENIWNPSGWRTWQTRHTSDWCVSRPPLRFKSHKYEKVVSRGKKLLVIVRNMVYSFHQTPRIMKTPLGIYIVRRHSPHTERYLP